MFGQKDPQGVPVEASANGRVQADAGNQIGLFAERTGEYAIFALDARGIVASWSHGAERIKGYRGDEIIGRHFSVFYPSEQIATGYPEWELEQAARTGVYLDQGWRLRKDGSRFWAHVVITAQRSDDGSLYGFIKVVRDETEARTRQQRSTQRFTDLFDLAPVGIALFDEFDRVLHANGALCDLLGYRLNELHRMTGASLLHPDEKADGIVTPAGSASPHHHWPVSQLTLARSDGQAVICELRSATSMDDDGSRFWQVVFQDVTEQRRRTEMLYHQATHDELTGLPNRAGINERLGELLGSRHPGHVAVLLCDLDNFKRVNDSLGHEGGDELLVALARRLTAGLPEGCTAARLAGDEYLVICPELEDVGGLDGLTTRVSELLRTVVQVRDQPVWVSASIGAAVVESADTTGEDLLRLSDAAMFAAKNRRPGSVSVATPELISSMGDQVQREGELRDALRDDGLELHYQPTVDRNGSIVMAEALVRWPHPEQGMVGPPTILAVAERGNLLRDLDRWVLRTALGEAASWPEEQGRSARISVNLSGLLPDDPNFAREISDIIAECGIAGNRVVLEVVETSLVGLPDRPREAMVELGERGVEFAVDDFGTGYSSLQRLKDLPAKIIKIDRGFVAGVENDPADFSIVRAVVEMSRGMERHCVAEGVENSTQFHLLDGLSVGAFQGFLFGPPTPTHEFRALLDRGSLPTPNTE